MPRQRVSGNMEVRLVHDSPSKETLHRPQDIRGSRETSDFDAIQKDCVGFVQQFVVFPPTKKNQKPLYPMEPFW